MDSFFPFIHKIKKEVKFEQEPLFLEIYPPPPIYKKEEKDENNSTVIIIQL